jgi:hypothetical protein
MDASQWLQTLMAMMMPRPTYSTIDAAIIRSGWRSGRSRRRARSRARPSLASTRRSIVNHQPTVQVEELESSEGVRGSACRLQRSRVEPHRLGTVWVEAEQLTRLAAEQVSRPVVPIETENAVRNTCDLIGGSTLAIAPA